MKKLLAALLALMMVLGTVAAYAETTGAWDGAYMDEEDFKAYIQYDLANILASIEEQLDDETLAAVTAAKEAGDAAIEAAGSVAEVKAAYADAYDAILAAVAPADGLYTYKKLSNAERTEILGILERYAVNTGITGVSLFENGGYVMYNPRITLGTENYIVGYGLGLLAEGAITADFAYETNPDWTRYYHTYESSDPGTLNYLNDQGAQVGDMYGYTAASFFTNFMNETKDGYDWVPELAKEKPVAVNDEDGDGMATTWRFEVRTGETDGLKYKTGSEIESRKAFDNRPVALEDYEYAFKLLLTQSNQLYRGSELANTKSGAIAGAKDFYNATASGFDADAWAKVGVKTYVEDGKNYFEVTFTEEQTQFYTMYYIASSLYAPIPEEFIELVTVKNYLGFNADSTETPADNALVVGPYYVERYDADQQVVYKKNPNYVFADTKYAIAGIHDKIYTAAASDTTAGFNEFLAEHFDSTGIPQEYLNEYRNDPRTRSTTGNSNFKLNVNATNAETWEYLFGTDGVVAQTAKEDYWDLKPAVGNHHFIQAISYSIDRLTFANARGSIPSVDYLASNYMSDPENGLSYSVTEAHQKAVAGLLEDTDGYGYSLELARDYFRLAMTELEAEGAYVPGTAEAPTEIHVEIAWMYPTHEENYHNEIKNFIETAFNDESVTGGAYKLSVDFWVGNEWSDVYYNKMMVGQFDIGFGSISGNSLDPIGFVSVLSSDQDISGSFTLNWGVDTNDPDAYPIVYDNMRWSFDALYNAVNSQAIVAAGQNKPQFTIDYAPIEKNEDGSYTGSFTIVTTLPDITVFTVTDVVCCNYERYYNGDGTYDESSVEFTAENLDNGAQVITFTVPAELAADYATGSGTSAEPKGDTGFDLYFDLEFNGAASTGLYYSVNDSFVVE
ncbi:MAG: hypothetical protein IKR36_07380 [Clostridia bacterium]|nr:hypothetical protein [Clostridia bacterium]